MILCKTWCQLVLVVLILFVSGCHRPQKQFELLSSSDTNIDFNNLLTESDTFNVLTFEYMYNGAGVGVGDFNNDGLTDIFFAGNMVSSKLYLNKGDLEFEDITSEAGVGTDVWCTGVSVADINQDNLPDIYVSTVNPHVDKASPNLLFMNKGLNKNGMPVFEEAAAKAGLADLSYSTQAAFLDYDLDGDLDMYLLTNALERYTRNTPIGQRHDGSGKSVDKLFRNDGNDAQGVPVYRDVSREAGILSEGWGLGIVVNDINADGYPDVYTANDFLSNDHLYINNRDATFTNRVGECLKHQEYNGMGADMGDINNDGLNDIVVVDMMPEDNLRQKTMFSNTGYDRFMKNMEMNYQPQYTRNVLQLNNGNGTFSDIGYLAGMYATDWSWSALIADYDNDGWQDILITNGYRKDITDLDFVAYSKESSMFGTDEARLKKAMKAVEAIEGVKKPNCLFLNNKDLTFTEAAGTQGLDQPSYSNGAAYADLDNDGDLDLVMNNINDKAFVYRNTIIDSEKTDHHYLRLKLKGREGNHEGLGAKVEIRYGGHKQYREHQVHRGYQSSVEAVMHFGLGDLQRIDTLRITWPGGAVQQLYAIDSDQLLVVDEKNAVQENDRPLKNEHVLFKEVAAQQGILYKHAEREIIDFKVTPALPHKFSQSGPAIAVGDTNNDGLEDFIIGGSAGTSACRFLQQKDGTFKHDSLPVKSQEDMGILLFDADHDNDLDLYCVSGSTEFGKASSFYQHRFYKNTGTAFIPDTAALPAIESSGSCVTACDFDKDGDQDLFVGGRVSPAEYPQPPRSYLLENDGQGHFKDVIASVAPAVQRAGMVTAALWTDMDNDGWIDLALVGEWMPISFFKNENGRSFKPAFAASPGWWNSITGGDFDNDGDVDYICGNLGWNSLYKASEKEPVSIYAKDFDNSGSVDPLITRYIQGKEYLTHPRETLTDQIVGFKKKLTRYHTYGATTFPDLLSPEMLTNALHYQSTCFASSFVENQGGGKFVIRPLPVEAQVSPLFGILATDVDHDDNLDVLAIGNSYAEEPLSGFYDAGIGTCLLGRGDGTFSPVRAARSGFRVDRDAKALGELAAAGNRRLWIATSNQDSLRVFEQNHRRPVRVIKLHPGDTHAEITLKNGHLQRREFYCGSGYLSQSSRVLTIPENAQKIVVVDYLGTKREEAL
jgi:hypothetical protein